MAILQASKLAYKDDVICLTLRFKLQCSKFTGSYKAEEELYLEMYEQSKCLIQITQPKWLLSWNGFGANKPDIWQGSVPGQSVSARDVDKRVDL